MKLSQVLRTTVEQLKSEADYYWGQHHTCNCGHVAQVVMRLTGQGLWTLIEKECVSKKLYQGCWNEMSKESPVCADTGLPESTILSALVQAGMSLKDIAELEYLSNPVVRSRTKERLGVKYVQMSERAHVIAYLKEWADMLDEQEQFQPTQLPESARQVRVPAQQTVRVKE